MGPSQEEIVFFIDDTQPQAAVKRTNQGILSVEKQGETSFGRLTGAVDKHGNDVIKIFDRSKSAIDRQISSLNQMSALYGKTGIEKLNAQYDVSIKKLTQMGATAKELDKVTASFGKMKKAQEELDKASNTGNPQRTLFLGLKDLFEGRSAYSLVEFGKTLGSLQGIALVGGAAAAALLTVGFASMESTKSLAAYGVELQNVGLRMGLTAAEVAKFSFAARETGLDISVFERSVKGLTSAIDDNSSAGDKARTALQKLGVVPRDLNGEIRPTADLLLDLSKALNNIPNAIDRNKAGIDIFKKAWLEMAPAILGVSKSIEEFEKNGLFAPSEVEKEKWLEYNRQIEVADGLWSKLGIKLKEGLAGTLWIDIKGEGAKFLLGFDGNNATPKMEYTAAGSALNGALAFFGGRDAARAQFSGYAPGSSGIDVTGATRPQFAPGFVPPGTPDPAATARMQRISLGSGLEGAQSAASRAKKVLEEARTVAGKPGVLNAVTANQNALAVQLAQTDYDRKEAIVKALTEGPRQLESFTTAINGFGGTKEKSPVEELNDKFDIESRKLNSPENVQTRAETSKLKGQLLGKYATRRFDIVDESNRTSASAGLEAYSESDKIFKGLFDANEKRYKEGLEQGNIIGRSPLQKIENTELTSIPLQRTSQDLFKDRQEQEKRSEQLIEINAKPNDELTTQRKLYGERIQLLEDETKFKKDEVFDLVKTERAQKQALFDIDVDHDRKLRDIKLQSLDKLAEVQKHQMEEVAKSAEGLFHTLFTKPSEFGKQLGNTLKDAILKPIESGLGELVSKPIDRVVHGSNGQGGIAGFFHGLFNGNKSSSDPAVQTATNTKDTVDILAQIAGKMGVNLSAIPGVPAVSSSSSSDSFGGGGGGGVVVLPGTQGANGRNGSSGVVYLPQASRSGSGSRFGGFGGLAGLFSSGGNLSTGSSAQDALAFGSIPRFRSTFGSAPSGASADGSVSDISGATPPILGGSILGIGAAAGGAGAAGGGGIFAQIKAIAARAGLDPKKLLSSVFNSGDIAVGGSTTMTASNISASFGGGILGTLAGGAAGFASSPAGGALGGSLALAGILGREPKGFKQTAETVGGGALLGANIGSKIPSLGIVGGLGAGAGIGLAVNGFQRKGASGELESIGGGALAGGSIGFSLGGPVGGLIGLGVGAAAGALSGLIGQFVVTFRQQVKDQVQKLYGLKLNDGYADQIGQIAKQSYGGSISAAIRSPQVQDMLSIYAQATGQKFLFSNKPRPAYLTESGGQLTQQATYVNGQAYSYGSATGLPTYGGVPTSTLPQYNLGQTTTHVTGGANYGGTTLQLDGPATTALLNGQIAGASQQVATAYSNAQQNSFDRRANASRVLNPSLVTS